MDLNINDIIELARRSVRNGRPALEDPLTRDELSWCWKPKAIS